MEKGSTEVKFQLFENAQVVGLAIKIFEKGKDETKE